MTIQRAEIASERGEVVAYANILQGYVMIGKLDVRNNDDQDDVFTIRTEDGKHMDFCRANEICELIR